MGGRLGSVDDRSIGALAALVGRGGVVVLSGAGLSTESGIPDYRGPTGLARAQAPMQYQAFVQDEQARRRYWARSYLGWRRMSRAAPNAGHVAVAELQQRGLVRGVITQNVDGLHQAAGTREVVELHGGLTWIVCLGCGARTTRTELDGRLRGANAGWSGQVRGVNPDGDVELADDDVAGFRPVDCRACGGLLKPDVVFFGESVPPERVQRCYGLVEQARLLLVVGSSLTVMSGRRFVRRAAELAIPVAIVNQGPTRGDEFAQLTLDAPLGDALPALARYQGEGSKSLRKQPYRSSPASPRTIGS
jgi:NAD-dependent SIR2 family protein deacetylase